MGRFRRLVTAAFLVTSTPGRDVSDNLVGAMRARGGGRMNQIGELDRIAVDERADVRHEAP